MCNWGCYVVGTISFNVFLKLSSCQTFGLSINQFGVAVLVWAWVPIYISFTKSAYNLSSESNHSFDFGKMLWSHKL